MTRREMLKTLLVSISIPLFFGFRFFQFIYQRIPKGSNTPVSKMSSYYIFGSRGGCAYPEPHPGSLLNS